jgi:hypothetical protein
LKEWNNSMTDVVRECFSTVIFTGYRLSFSHLLDAPLTIDLEKFNK